LMNPGTAERSLRKSSLLLLEFELYCHRVTESQSHREHGGVFFLNVLCVSMAVFLIRLQS
jgi:hypothetical protein